MWDFLGLVIKTRGPYSVRFDRIGLYLNKRVGLCLESARLSAEAKKYEQRETNTFSYRLVPST